MAQCNDPFIVVRFCDSQLKKVPTGQFLVLLSWNVHQHTVRSNDSIAIFAEGVPVCLEQLVCVKAEPRGHLLHEFRWPAGTTEDIGSIHFSYVSGQTQKILAKSNPVFIADLLRFSNQLQRDESIHKEHHSNPKHSFDDVRISSSENHHRSALISFPIWMKTTGECVYRFHGVVEKCKPASENHHQRNGEVCHQARMVDDQQLPPPLPPRSSTAYSSHHNLHKPLMRSHAIWNSSNAVLKENPVVDQASHPFPHSDNSSTFPLAEAISASQQEDLECGSHFLNSVQELMSSLPSTSAVTSEVSLFQTTNVRENDGNKTSAQSLRQNPTSISPKQESSTVLDLPASSIVVHHRLLPSMSTLPQRSRCPRIQENCDEDPLPPMWEARVDSHGRIFYVDHRSRTTAWKRPKATGTENAVAEQNAPDSVADVISRQQLDRRYQSIRRTINSNRVRREGTNNNCSVMTNSTVTTCPTKPSTGTSQQTQHNESTPTQATSASSLESTTTTDTALHILALKFVTRPDFFTLLQNNLEALELYSCNPAIRRLLAKLSRNPGCFTRYQHNRELVKFLNMFVDQSKPLPVGWEVRRDRSGRPFYIDHSTRTTWYIDPRFPCDTNGTPTITPCATLQSSTTHDQSDSGRAPIPPPRPSLSASTAVGTSSPPPPLSSSSSVSSTASSSSAPAAAAATTTTTATTTTAVAAAALLVPSSTHPVIPIAYNEKVVAFVRQPNVSEILQERHPDYCNNNRLRDAVNRVRKDGTSALDRLSSDELMDLAIVLSLFENEIMSYVPPAAVLPSTNVIQEHLLSSGSSAPGRSVSPCNSPLILPRAGRTPFQQVRRDFEAKLRHFYRKLESKGYGQGPNKFKIPVRRNSLLEDAYVKIMSASRKDLQKSKLQITFVGEDGLDYGGVSREFFFLLSRQMFNPYYGLFEYSASDTYTVQISPMSQFVDNYNDWFRFCGRILGLALVHQYLLDVFFTRPFYKNLLRLPVSLDDLESLDAEFHQSMEWMKETDLSLLSIDLELTFAVSEDVGGQIVERELKTNGRNIFVDEKNKKDYIERMVRWRLDRGVAEQAQSVVRGFYDVLEPRLVSIFDAREMELVLAGTAEIDIVDWRKHTEYRSGYHDKHPIVHWFWAAIERFSNEQRLRLIQFVTGTSSIPYEGFSALRGSTGPRQFCVEKWGQTTSLPRAHTCFNRLDLPPYESAETLYDKLLLAVEETSTFGIE